VALGLGLLGVYGVMSDSVARKRRDIALRLALGAPARAIVAGVFRDGVRVAAAGAAAGLLVSWVIVQAVIHSDSSFRAPAAWAWIVCPVVLLAVVCVATVLPARWALAVDPLVMTRDE
jgi:ABC-type antimicrobial peptide transport system permease subunit